MPTLYAIPAFTDNYIWTLTDDQSSALVVDPGDAEPVIAAAETHGWRPTTVLVTHHHPDHVGGLPELRRRWPSLRIIGPEDPRITGLDEVVNDGDQVRVEGLDLTFRVMAVPGHTLSHIAYVGDPWLFCGDTLFSLGCGRLFEGTPAQMLDSLDRVAALPGEQLVCCTHEYTAANGRFAINVDPGNPALVQRIADVAACRAKNQPSLPVTLASERACNPFLRCDQPSVQRSIAAATGSMPADRLDSFARLRRMKDAFRG
ncbi:MAG: hydroxyacylglutathione hydrolase [Lysobacteraceae bacterium]